MHEQIELAMQHSCLESRATKVLNLKMMFEMREKIKPGEMSSLISFDESARRTKVSKMIDV